MTAAPQKSRRACGGSSRLMRSTMSGKPMTILSDTTFPAALTPLSVRAARFHPTCQV